MEFPPCSRCQIDALRRRGVLRPSSRSPDLRPRRGWRRRGEWDGGRSVDEGGRVDAVVLVSAPIEGEGALRSPRRAPGRGAGRKAQMGQDSASDGGILDRGHQAHRAGAPRADYNGPAPRPVHQRLPVQTALAIRIVGADQSITRRWDRWDRSITRRWDRWDSHAGAQRNSVVGCLEVTRARNSNARATNRVAHCIAA